MSLLHSDSVTFVRSTYSEKKLAIEKALPYSQQEKEDIYVWEQPIDAQQREYTLRKRSDIIDIHSSQIVHRERYEERSVMKFKVKNGLRRLITD